jgi:hypothetical protein
MGGSRFEVSKCKKLARSYIEHKLGLGAYAHIVPTMQEAEVGGSWSEAGPKQKCETLSEK